MRVSTINAEMVESDEFWIGALHQKRKTAFQSVDAGSFNGLNQSSTKTFKYRDNAGRFGEGFVSYFKADMSKD